MVEKVGLQQYHSRAGTAQKWQEVLSLHPQSGRTRLPSLEDTDRGICIPAGYSPK